VKLVVFIREVSVKIFEIFLSFTQFLQVNIPIRLEIGHYPFLPRSFIFSIQ
jgi:hypothetical protein